MDPPTFTISPSHLAFAIKAPRLNNAFHTREDVYIVDVAQPHSTKPAHLTPHDHGAISGLTFSPDGSKLAWLEMAEDGYESDRRVAVVHDTKKAVRWTDTWDRSPNSITVSPREGARLKESGAAIPTRSTCWQNTRARSSPTTYMKQVTCRLHSSSIIPRHPSRSFPNRSCCP
jgi:dipeptidyl aminopeptidase/acylaminoacyl peptidase